MLITVTIDDTRIQAFPPGTVEGPFVFQIQRVVGETEIVATQEADQMSVTFDVDVRPGPHQAVVTKNGIGAAKPFTVPAADVSLLVPAAITVTMP